MCDPESVQCYDTADTVMEKTMQLATSYSFNYGKLRVDLFKDNSPTDGRAYWPKRELLPETTDTYLAGLDYRGLLGWAISDCPLCPTSIGQCTAPSCRPIPYHSAWPSYQKFHQRSPAYDYHWRGWSDTASWKEGSKTTDHFCEQIVSKAWSAIRPIWLPSSTVVGRTSASIPRSGHTFRV
ncbi:hypothetical protein P175DRAFT_0532930 [Aspergillus ochraceoroseus IBT 24754]|uniref:Uncharacterized protein n=1 Tax=Aspergillus ochraceoroseus IBT 24754 TaxID=1392256 RepID=A0A2T5LUL3_9EURO|nr:uncharacterized protein P175DRAFT_0532930 [Aspergillus ochraceoroseus IBT 24754]PTU19967.1 hypothetical protein P175DRAFT_0532930 [Aspergillus ochraceoroseus IBT 24754]